MITVELRAAQREKKTDRSTFSVREFSDFPKMPKTLEERSFEPIRFPKTYNVLETRSE
jgi:hypothetical protein